MDKTSDEYLKYKGEANKFKERARNWCEGSQRPFNDKIINTMHKHLQGMINPVDYHFPTSYFDAVNPVINPDDK